VISEKTTAAEKEVLIVDYDDCMSSYESQFHAYMTWLDEDAAASLVLVASMEDRFSADIVELEQSHQMWTFLRSRYEPTGQSTFLTLVEVHNEETCLQDAALLRVSSVLATRSSVARPVVPVPPASPLIALSATRGESASLHCDHCGQDGHVKAFCYRKMKAQKAQARRSSQGTGSARSERSSAGSETQEILMLLHRLVASTSSGVVGSVTEPSTLTGSDTASQSSALGPPSTPSLGTDPWCLDSSASFHMTPHSTHISSLRPSYRHCTIHTADGSPLSVARQGTICSDSFDVPDVSIVPDLTMHCMSTGQIIDHDCRVILDPNFCYVQDCPRSSQNGRCPSNV
jgi:hypothetical protein